MLLSGFSRVRIAHLPTPFEELPALSAYLGGPRIFAKRDDCTGLAFGGNKTRKLEFLMADAISHGADSVITCGGLQSNHVRQTAAAAARLGLKCHLVLQQNVDWDQPDYPETGNIVIDHLCGAELHVIGQEEHREVMMQAVAERLEAQGAVPYIIPLGGSNHIGARGYVICAQELIADANARDISLDYVYLAAGSGGTQAGLVTGFVGSHCDVAVVGVDVEGHPEHMDAATRTIAAETAADLNIAPESAEAGVIIKEGFVGAGYGMPTREMQEAVETVARLEGLILDPVYTGKAMAALFAAVREGTFKPSDTVVFLHTGGTPALFAYRTLFAPAEG